MAKILLPLSTMLSFCYFMKNISINNAIAREKEIKGWTREKKEALIKAFNPNYIFLNEELFGSWQPEGMGSRIDH